MFNFSSLFVSFIISTPTSSVSKAETNLNDIAIVQVFPQNIDGIVQTDTAKFAIPFDYKGVIHWAEVSFEVKEDHFDAVKAEYDYQVKLQKSLECEQERHVKHETKASAKA